MTPKERLEAVQDRLVAQGVVDIKFTFNEGVESYSLDAVRLMIAKVLEAYAVGEYKPMAPIGDKYPNGETL